MPRFAISAKYYTPNIGRMATKGQQLTPVVRKNSSSLHPATLEVQLLTHRAFRKARLNEPANAGDASRATIWQGNCHVEDQFFYSNITRAQNTIPIQYPISNCPAKPTGSFKRLYRKRARGLCSRTFIRGCACDKALTFFVPNPALQLIEGV